MQGTSPSVLDVAGQPLACSWSGGKDSALALHRAIRAGGRPLALLSMLTETGQRSRSHGLHVSMLRAQARALGVPLVTRSATWGDYEAAFLSALQEMSAVGVRAVVFGDIDGESNRRWAEMLCTRGGLRAVEPLWARPRDELLHEFLGLGFRATLVAVRDGVLDSAMLGRTLDETLLQEFVRAGIDLSGEGGEYHTVVTRGPLFAHPIELAPGQRVLRDGCWFLDVAVAGT